MCFKLSKATIRKQHKWFGLFLSFFLIMFCISGVLLNHAKSIRSINVDRRWMPTHYYFKKWDKGLMRGTVKWNGNVLIYGTNGIWKTDSMGGNVEDFNEGFPKGEDWRNIRGMAITSGNRLWAAGIYDLYQYYPLKGWKRCNIPLAPHERITDITTKGDTLVLLGRSRVYLSVPPYQCFAVQYLKAGDDADGKVSLFQTVWQLHSGEMWGLTGRLLIDAMAVLLIFLCLTGVVQILLPKSVVRKHRKRLVHLLSLHTRWGRATIVALVFLTFTGWMLRPPMLVAIAHGKVPAIPFTHMDNTNPWYDNLRAIRYDWQAKEWLLYSDDGFYALKNWNDIPRKLRQQPPVSVMGINVFEQQNNGEWLIGSFSGLFKWNRYKHKITDEISGEIVDKMPKVPFSKSPIAGYSKDFARTTVVVDYHRGTEFPIMPSSMSTIPMALRQVCIEVHTGRIYTFLGSLSILYISIIGIAIFWCLWTGWKLGNPFKRNAKKNS